jgi:hypothetical protein
MTGTNWDSCSRNWSRSYLNHVVFGSYRHACRVKKIVGAHYKPVAKVLFGKSKIEAQSRKQIEYGVDKGICKAVKRTSCCFTVSGHTKILNLETRTGFICVRIGLSGRIVNAVLNFRFP